MSMKINKLSKETFEAAQLVKGVSMRSRVQGAENKKGMPPISPSPVKNFSVAFPKWLHGDADFGMEKKSCVEEGEEGRSGLLSFVYSSRFCDVLV